MKHIISVLSIIFSLAGVACGGIEHIGSNDPLTEGWQKFPTANPNLSVGPVIESSSYGYNGWYVQDDSTDIGQLFYYTNFTTQEMTDAQTHGWTVASRIRLANNPDPAFTLRDTSVAVEFHTGSQSFGIYLESLDSLTTTVTCNNDRFTISGIGFHLYSLSYSPQTSHVSFSVDDVTLSTNISPYSFTSTPHLYWGSLSNADTGRGNYNSVVFVPEPGSGFLILSGFVLLVARRSRNAKP